MTEWIRIGEHLLEYGSPADNNASIDRLRQPLKDLQTTVNSGRSTLREGYPTLPADVKKYTTVFLNGAVQRM